MKAGLITQLNPTRSNLGSPRDMASPLENLCAAQYSRRNWRRRLPAVIIASVLLVILLLVAGISLDGAPLLALIPLVCLPLLGAIALGGA